MANPQKENGYTPIANELLEALGKTRISGEARQMLDIILRKTYGWNKSTDPISTTQFTAYTGLTRRSIYKARRKLREMNIITVSQKGARHTLSYSIQKDYDNWVLSPKKEVSPKKVTRVSPKKRYTKDNITKDNIYMQKENPVATIVSTYFTLRDYTKDPQWCKQSFSRHCKPAKALLDVARGELPIVLTNLRKAKEYFAKKQLDWTLETVLKRWIDITKEGSTRRYA